MYTVPNVLTAFRIVATPFLLWLSMQNYPPEVVGALYGAMALTDYFDGKLARLLHQESIVGEWLDPIADKIATIPFLYIFWERGKIASIVFLLLFCREIFVTIGRTIMWWRGRRAPAQQLGKIKFVCECVGVALMLMGFFSFGQLALCVAIVFAYFSLIHYMLLWNFIPMPIRDFFFEHIWLKVFPFVTRLFSH